MLFKITFFNIKNFPDAYVNVFYAKKSFSARVWEKMGNMSTTREFPVYRKQKLSNLFNRG